MAAIRSLLIKFIRWLVLGERGGICRSVRGKDNVFQAQGATFNNVELDIIGNKNTIVIGPGSVFNNVCFHVRGDGHRIEFGAHCRISRGGVIWFEDHDCQLHVGPNTTMVDVQIAVTEPGSRVVIGEDCMFANDIDIRTGDSHSVVDVVTGKRLNPAADVVIEDHVWIAPHVVILKGVHIGRDSVVATGAVVTKSFGSGVIIGGNPAAVLKSGISWKRERLLY